MKLQLTAAFIATVCAMGFAPTYTAAATVEAAEDGKRKINISGRQRMLSQRMAKAVCFASIGIDHGAHIDMARKAHGEFDKALKGLRFGDSDLQINQETGPNVLAELDGVDTLWVDYGAAVLSAVSSGEVSGATLESVSSLSVPTLVQMNRAVGEFEKRYGASDIHPTLALAINVSGRQRMLSQKASKEFCLKIAGNDAQGNLESLRGTVELFESSLMALMDGNEDIGLPEAPTDEIYDQLELVQGLWEPVAKIFKAALDGTAPSDAEIAFVAEQNNVILVEMNRAVGMYAGL